MSLRFACPNCHQKLSVSLDKAGRKTTCPKCKHPMVVPQAPPHGSASAIHAPAKAQELVGPPPASVTGPADAPSAIGPAELPAAISSEPAPIPSFDQFEVYDDDTEIIYDTDQPANLPGGAPNLGDRISLPRWTIYVQGGLLALLSFFCFLIGLIAGGLGSGSGGGGSTGPKMADLYGHVTYELAQRQTGDDGALIIALPQKSVPDEKAPTVDLFPPNAVAPPTHRGIEIIRILGGGVQRADATGNFKLSLPKGDYFVLVVSNIQDRPPSQTIPTGHVAEMGRFLEQPKDLIGKRKYRWEKVTLKTNQRFDVSFD
jgi:hypothetical protein